MRTSVAGGGGGVERPLHGEAWDLEIDLVPPRTAVEPPPEPPGEAGAAGPRRSRRGPSAAFRPRADRPGPDDRGSGRLPLGPGALRGPVGPERRHAGRRPPPGRPDHPGAGPVEVWDDRGHRYEVAPIHGAARPGWSETSLEVAPGLDPQARALGCACWTSPERAPPRGGRATRRSLRFRGRAPAAVVSVAPGATWVILPTYDEAENVEAMLEAVLASLDGAGIACRVLVVDDGSPDGTATSPRPSPATEPRVHVLRRRQAGDRPRLPRRLPPRARRGRRPGRGDGLRLLPRPGRACPTSWRPRTGPTWCSARATSPGGGVATPGPAAAGHQPRRLLVRAAHPRGARSATSPAASSASAARCWRPSRSTRSRAAGYGFQIEMTYRALLAGFRVVEVPIIFVERERGSPR